MLRGQGVALFRQEVAKGMSEAAEEMKQANLDTNFFLFSMWTESIKNFAEYGKGNTIFLDGSAEGIQNTMRQIQSMLTNDKKQSLVFLVDDQISCKMHFSIACYFNDCLRAKETFTG